MAGNIYGTTYNGTQSEYQYFPEDFFSGSDVSLYFDDVYMEDVQALEFGLQEKVLPIYGYNSYTYDATARGQRIVQGSFAIAFKEAGYVYSVMSHIGALREKAKPLLAYKLAGTADNKPKWLGNVNETIEELLNRKSGVPTESATTTHPPDWPTLSLSQSGDAVKEWQNFVIHNSSGTRYKGIYVASLWTIKSGIYKYGSKRSNEIKLIKKRLNEYLYKTNSGLISAKLVENTSYDNALVKAVKAFQKHFSTSLAVDGIVGPKTVALLNKPFSVSGTFDAPTKLSVMMFQKANGIKATGVLENTTRAKIKVSVKVSAKKLLNGAEGDFADYEATVWGEKSVVLDSTKDNPYFYRSEGQKWLLQDGFDIYINYGPLVADVAMDGGAGGKSGLVSYNNTVKAIRGVQLTGVQQVLSPTGEPIAERYTFIAKNLD